ncbi:MAG: menaquinone biosynthesis protein [Saprospiraceae bacterium]|nr:menaquinone biosynthesis protein [Saprospiraceae bacterium]MDW8483179.1 menaquinone biosynthesis protein [Saprospiraceae bacterium]
MRLSVVSYLNTKPFIYGLLRSPLAEHLELSLDIPSMCAQKLLRDEADLALAPVAVIPELPEAHLVSDFCIGAIGAVRTVCIFSEKPIDQVRYLLLDFHSRTSVALVPILCQHYWGISPKLLPAFYGYERAIGGDTAGLVIGDRAIGLEKRFPYVYDLGQVWKDWTGLPFVFAAWISTRPLADNFVRQFNEALADGIAQIPKLVKILPTFPDFDLETYFQKNISYPLDESKWAGLQRFLSYLPGPKTTLLPNRRLGYAVLYSPPSL